MSKGAMTLSSWRCFGFILTLALVCVVRLRVRRVKFCCTAAVCRDCTLLYPQLVPHEPARLGDAAFRQRFVAQVVDDRELASVTLNWRFRGESEYTRTAMSRVSSSSTWTGQVPTSPSESRSIEYFIEARDVGGNRTVRGFVFSPLVRRIINVEPTNVPVVTENEPAAPASKTIYYVLGALALGIIAGAASSRSSGGTDNGECGAEGCSVVIRFEPPVTQ